MESKARVLTLFIALAFGLASTYTAAAAFGDLSEDAPVLVDATNASAVVQDAVDTTVANATVVGAEPVSEFTAEDTTTQVTDTVDVTGNETVVRPVVAVVEDTTLQVQDVSDVASETGTILDHPTVADVADVQNNGALNDAVDASNVLNETEILEGNTVEDSVDADTVVADMEVAASGLVDADAGNILSDNLVILDDVDVLDLDNSLNGLQTLIGDNDVVDLDNVLNDNVQIGDLVDGGVLNDNELLSGNDIDVLEAGDINVLNDNDVDVLNGLLAGGVDAGDVDVLEGGVNVSDVTIGDVEVLEDGILNDSEILRDGILNGVVVDLTHLVDIDLGGCGSCADPDCEDECAGSGDNGDCNQTCSGGDDGGSCDSGCHGNDIDIIGDVTVIGDGADILTEVVTIDDLDVHDIVNVGNIIGGDLIGGDVIDIDTIIAPGSGCNSCAEGSPGGSTTIVDGDVVSVGDVIQIVELRDLVGGMDNDLGGCSDCGGHGGGVIVDIVNTSTSSSSANSSSSAQSRSSAVSRRGGSHGCSACGSILVQNTNLFWTSNGNGGMVKHVTRYLPTGVDAGPAGAGGAFVSALPFTGAGEPLGSPVSYEILGLVIAALATAGLALRAGSLADMR